MQHITLHTWQYIGIISILKLFYMNCSRSPIINCLSGTQLVGLLLAVFQRELNWKTVKYGGLSQGGNISIKIR